MQCNVEAGSGARECIAATVEGGCLVWRCVWL